MTNIEIIQAILAGKALDVRQHNGDWYAFHTIGADIEISLNVYIIGYAERYARAEFRIKPKTVRYQARAYRYGNEILVWTSTCNASQKDFASAYGGNFRWLEETQEKEYTL